VMKSSAGGLPPLQFMLVLWFPFSASPHYSVVGNVADMVNVQVHRGRGSQVSVQGLLILPLAAS
jgi:hypothetical protein